MSPFTGLQRDASSKLLICTEREKERGKHTHIFSKCTSNTQIKSSGRTWHAIMQYYTAESIFLFGVKSSSCWQHVSHAMMAPESELRGALNRKTKVYHVPIVHVFYERILHDNECLILNMEGPEMTESVNVILS